MGIYVRAAYDFLSSDQGNFNLIISYNSTNDYDDYDEAEQYVPVLNQAGSVRKSNSGQIPRLANMISLSPRLEKFYYIYLETFLSFFHWNLVS